MLSSVSCWFLGGPELRHHDPAVSVLRRHHRGVLVQVPPRAHKSGCPEPSASAGFLWCIHSNGSMRETCSELFLRLLHLSLGRLLFPKRILSLSSNNLAGVTIKCLN